MLATRIIYVIFTVMRINIHWGEFRGPVERTEIKFPLDEQELEENYWVYKYKIELRGYLPFTLFKNIHSKNWIAEEVIDPSISDQVIFYAKKIIDDFELKSEP
jgi:hypothetical protein